MIAKLEREMCSPDQHIGKILRHFHLCCVYEIGSSVCQFGNEALAESGVGIRDSIDGLVTISARQLRRRCCRSCYPDAEILLNNVDDLRCHRPVRSELAAGDSDHTRPVRNY